MGTSTSAKTAYGENGRTLSLLDASNLQNEDWRRQRDAKVCDKYHDERVKQLDPSKFTGISGEVQITALKIIQNIMRGIQ